MEKGLDSGKAALSKYMVKKQKDEQGSDSVHKAVASVAKDAKKAKEGDSQKMPKGKVDTKAEKHMDPKMFGNVGEDEAKAKKKKRPYLED